MTPCLRPPFVALSVRRPRRRSRRVVEFDRYQGKGVPDGRVSLSLRLTFRVPERTLTDDEVEEAMDAHRRRRCASQHGAERR